MPAAASSSASTSAAPPAPPPANAFPPDACVALTGDFQFGRGQRTVQPQCQSRMLVWCKAGRGRVLVNGRPFDLEPKDAIFLPWNRELIYEADPRAPFLVGGIHLIPRHRRDVPLRFFVPHAPRDPLADCDFRADAPLPGLEGIRVARFGPAEPLELLAEYLVARFRHAPGLHAPAAVDSEPDASIRTADSYRLAELFLRETAAFFERAGGAIGSVGPAGSGAAATPTADAAATADLRRLMRFVENHLTEPLALRELAAFSGLSRSHIGRLFRHQLNTTPVEWITRTRIEHAKQILASSGLPVAQVGARVGIADPYYFSKLFKKTTGLSAKAYRRATALV